MTLHGLRLSVAGHLDVPFQEVDKVVFGYERYVARRLAGETKVLHLRVTVRTGRLSQTDGTVLLTTWLSGADHASQILGLDVQGLSNARSANDGFTKEGNLNAENDPYTPAYDSIEASLPSAGQHSTLVALGKDAGVVTSEVIAGTAGGVLFIGMVVGASLFFHRRRKRLNAAMEAQNNKLGDVTQVDVPSKPSKITDIDNKQDLQHEADNEENDKAMKQASI